MHIHVALLLCSAAISGVAADQVISYGIPAFNAATTVDLLAATNSTVFTFEPGRHHNAMPDRTEGFVLLRRPVRMWRAGGAGGRLALEASFNSSFTLGGAKPVAFVVLLDSISLGDGSLHGEANYTASASSDAAAVQVGPVRSYSPDYYGDVGLNVTVAPRGTRNPGAALAVWIEYDAVAHGLSVYVADGSNTKPFKPLLDAPLNLFAGRRTTETAYIGFFAGVVSDVIVGVRDWNLTVDGFPEESAADGKKDTWFVLSL